MESGILILETQNKDNLKIYKKRKERLLSLDVIVSLGASGHVEPN
jgi:hypothetical protein